MPILQVDETDTQDSLLTVRARNQPRAVEPGNFLLHHTTPGAVVQSLSQVWLFAAPWISAQQASVSFTISQSLLKLMSI